MKLIIEDDEGRRTIVPFRGEQVTIGRGEGNHVRLSEKNVSRKHARILREGARYVVEDLKSFTGIRVNGERVRGRRQVQDGDLIQISEFDLILQMSPEELRSRPALDDDEEATAVKQRAPAGDATDDTESRKRAGAAAAAREEPPAERPGPPADLPPEDRPKLVGLAGALRGKEFVIARTLVSVGRAPENDVVVAEAPVSRTHCRLALVDGAWKVADAESRHGVQVNGAPYAQSPLLHGDVLELAGVPLLFAAAGQPVVLPPEPAPLPDAATALAAAPSGGGAAFGAGLSASAPPRGKGLAVLGAGALTAIALAVFFATRGGHEAPVAVERTAVARPAAAPVPRPAAEAPAAVAAAPAAAPSSESAPAPASGSGPAAAPASGSGSASASAPASGSAPAPASGSESASESASASPSAAGSPSPPAPAPDPDLEPRRLLNQGNQRMTAQDWTGAQESLEQALALKPGDAVLGNVYRSFAVLYSRQGRMEEGARYYRLYLPFCQNPTEKAALEKTLAEFDALPKGQAPAAH